MKPHRAREIISALQVLLTRLDRETATPDDYVLLGEIAMWYELHGRQIAKKRALAGTAAPPPSVFHYSYGSDGTRNPPSEGVPAPAPVALEDVEDKLAAAVHRLGRQFDHHELYAKVDRAEVVRLLNEARVMLRPSVQPAAVPADPDSKAVWVDYAAPALDAPAWRTADTLPPKGEAVNWNWQPIETAPKQRKVIVHYLNPLGKHRVVLACYYGPKSLEMHDDYEDVGTYDDESGATWADEGWYEEHDSDDPILPLGGAPTHWMPLPPAPRAAVQPPAPADVAPGIGHYAVPKPGVHLRSGGEAYARAVVASVLPFCLVSEWGDMIWQATVRREDFTDGGEVEADAWAAVLCRIGRDARASQGITRATVQPAADPPRHICTESGGGYHYSECRACGEDVPLPGDAVQPGATPAKGRRPLAESLSGTLAAIERDAGQTGDAR